MIEIYDRCPCWERILLDPDKITRSDWIVNKGGEEEFTNGYEYSILCKCGARKIVPLLSEIKKEVDKRYN